MHFAEDAGHGAKLHIYKRKEYSMLPKIRDDAGVARVTFCKYDHTGKDVSHLGAFARGESIRLAVTSKSPAIVAICAMAIFMQHHPKKGPSVMRPSPSFSKQGLFPKSA